MEQEPHEEPTGQSRNCACDWLHEIATWQFFVILLFATVLVYFPATRCGFVFDDRIYITENDEVKSPAGLLKIWLGPSAYTYYPLTLSTFWLEYRLWGSNPAGYHVVNILLHALNASLVLVLLKRLNVPGARLAALVFCLHPVCVESVAWISERKNLLSSLFSLLTVLVWLDFITVANRRKYLLSLGLFVLSLLAKTATCTLPLALALLSWWKGRSSRMQLVFSLVPFLLAAAGLAGVTVWVERTESYAVGQEFEIPFLARTIIAGRAVWFCLGKILWPMGLMTVYPRWEIPPGANVHLFWPVTVCLALGLLWRGRTRIGKAPFVAASCYIAGLLPALGFVNYAYMRFSFVADHFQYLACLGPISGLSALVARAVFRGDRSRGRIGNVSGFLFLAVLGVASWRLVGSYKDDETLWSTNVAKNPEGIAPRDHLGRALLIEGKFQQARSLFEEGLKIHPDSADFHFGLAESLARAGCEKEALRHLLETVRLDPSHSTAHRNLAEAFSAKGDDAAAVHHYQEALRTNPFPDKQAEIWNSLGLHHARQERKEEALKAFKKALDSDSNLAAAHFNLGLLYRERGDFEASIDHLNRALDLSPGEGTRIRPQLAESHFEFGAFLEKQGRYSEALHHFSETLHYRSRHSEARKAQLRIKQLLEKPHGDSSASRGDGGER